MLNHAAGSEFKRSDLKIVTTGILCRQRYQLEFPSQLVVLGQPQLRLKWERNTRTGQTQSQTRLIWHVIIIKLLFHKSEQYKQYLLFHVGQSDLLVPLVLFSVFERLAEAGDGLLQLSLLSVDPLHIGWSELLVLQLVLEIITLVFQNLQVAD